MCGYRIAGSAVLLAIAISAGCGGQSQRQVEGELWREHYEAIHLEAIELSFQDKLIDQMDGTHNPALEKAKQNSDRHLAMIRERIKQTESRLPKPSQIPDTPPAGRE